MAKKSAKKVAKKSAKKVVKKASTLAADADVILRVRMYRVGLGDCHLLSFYPGTAKAKHILIDCGSLSKGIVGNDIRDVISDIKTTTGNVLDVLVVTHEHEDHVSGFRTGKAEFSAIAIKAVWLAWTEDPKDTRAKALAKEYKDTLTALYRLADRLGAAESTPFQKEAAARLQEELEWFGSDTFAKTVDEAMDFVHSLGKPPLFIRPGQVLNIPGMDDFRFYVLGPPADKDALTSMGGDEDPELYASVGLASETGEEAWMPFARQCRRPVDHYPSYAGASASWRRIDAEYLTSSVDFALQMNKYTNNTSLVLAIEHVPDERVLLFPADAQLGNWLSWLDNPLKFIDQKSKTWDVSIESLLQRTVFYKVGHHSSHNATARRGLLQMGEDMVAFIPVDRDAAMKKGKSGWVMPATKLYEALLKKCNGRVYRADTGAAAQNDLKGAFEKRPELNNASVGTAVDWKQWRQAQMDMDDRIQIEDLYIDYFFR